MQDALLKVKGIQEKIEALKAEQLKIEQVASTELLNVLKKQGAFGLDFNTLVGGLLSVIETIQGGAQEMEDWKKAGQKFRGTAKPKASKSIKATTEVA